VVHGGGVEDRGAEQVHGDDTVALLAQASHDLEVGDDRRLDLQDGLDLVLVGPGHGAARGDVRGGEGHLVVGGPQVGALLEVVEQLRVEVVVVVDEHRALEESPPLDVDRVGQPDDDLLVPGELGVVERLDGEAQRRWTAPFEGERAGGRCEVLTGCRVRALGRVVDAHLLRVVRTQRAVQPDLHGTGRALLDEGDLPGEVDGRCRWHAHAVEGDLVDVVRTRTAGAQCAQGVAVHLEEAETVVGCAVADLLAHKVRERELEELPTGEVVGEGDGPPLGVVCRRSGVAVVEDVDEELGAAARPVHPEGDALALGPVLRHPGVHRRVGEAVDEAGERGDVDVHLQDVVGRTDLGDLSRRCVRRRERNRAACAVEGAEPERWDSRGARRGGRDSALEVVDDGARGVGARAVAEGPVVRPEVDVGSGPDDCHDDVDELAVAARGGDGVQDTVAAGEERVVVDEVGERDRHELPSTATDRARPRVGDDAVELELVVVGLGGEVVFVVVLLEVDLERVLLARIGVDPEAEVVGAGGVRELFPAEPPVEARRATGSPTGLEREGSAVGGRKIRVVRVDAPSADRTAEAEPPVVEGIAMFHVVEDQRRARGHGARGRDKRQACDDGRCESGGQVLGGATLHSGPFRGSRCPARHP
jgi:hypothetical protein